MEIATAIVLGANQQGRVEIAGALAKEAICISMSTHCDLEAAEAARAKQPSIVVLDVAIFNIESINVIRQLRDIDRALKIIVLMRQPPQHFSARYKRAGATVVLNASHRTGGLAFIIRALRAGFCCFDFIPAPINPRQWSYATEGALIATLTDRELTIFQALAKGLCNQSVAAEVGVNSRLVSVYKSAVLEKLQLKSPLQLCEMAQRNNFV